MRYIHIMEYYLAIKRNKMLVHAAAQINLKHYAKEKNPGTTDCILYNSIYIEVRIGKSVDIKIRLVLP